MRKDQQKNDYKVSLYVLAPLSFTIKDKLVVADTPKNAIRRLISENNNLFYLGMEYIAEVFHPNGNRCLRVRRII